MYLLRTARGKESLIGSILRKHGLEVHLPSEKGFLVCNNRPSPKLLFELKSYLQEVIEITEEEADRLLHPEEKTGEEIKTGSLVEVTSGVYQNFKGIVRRMPAPLRGARPGVDSRAVVDLNLFGRVLPVEVSIWLKYNQSFTHLQKEVELEDKWVPETEKRFFFQEVLSEFFGPYRSLFESQEAVDGFLAILELLDRHGSSPSVVTTMIDKDSEADEIYGAPCNGASINSVRQILEKVTLREHSSNVARIMLKLIKETYRDYENLIPKALVVSFSHDLGKILGLRGSGLYAKADHPLISAQKLGEIFSGKQPSWLRSALDSIRDHHRSTKDPFTLLLKESDSRAREAEIGLYSKELKMMEWSQWFDVKRFLEILRPEINVIQTGNRWKAFSFGSLAYCQPDFLYEGARRLASERKVLDMKLLRVSDKEQAIKKVVESLRQVGALSNDVGESFWGRTYEIHSERFRKKMFLIPLKIEAFGIPHEIERQKEGYLEIVRSVVPVGK